MGWLSHTFLILFKLFTLRAKPSDIPYSMVLMVLFAIGVLWVDCLTDVWFVNIVNLYDSTLTVRLSWYYSLGMSTIWVLIMYAMVRTLLTYYQVQDRLIQVLTAFLWVDFVMSLFYVSGVTVLAHMNLPLEVGSWGAWGLIAMFITYIYWQFMLYMHIIYNSVTISLLKAGIIALFYMLLQYNISEALINVMVIENPIR